MTDAIDLRHLQPPIKDQGRRGTCVAFAATAGHEVLCANGEDLCEEFLHWGAKQRDGLPRTVEGTTLAAAAATLADLGQPPEHHWPYDEARDYRAATYQPSTDALTAALPLRVTGGATITPSTASLLNALQAGQAVLLGVQLYSTWHFVTADGEIRMPAAGTTSFGGHAVLIVGYRPDGSGNGSFVVRNSWVCWPRTMSARELASGAGPEHRFLAYTEQCADPICTSQHATTRRCVRVPGHSR